MGLAFGVVRPYNDKKDRYHEILDWYNGIVDVIKK